VRVTVSIPDSVFHEAERARRRLRVPRSQFYTRALATFVRENSSSDLTARTNAALAKINCVEESGWENPGLEILRGEKA
jgi:metal-responsive CopG/Arc/MetJ family transcriptional regulator